jgi:hypothetical protein
VGPEVRLEGEVVLVERFVVRQIRQPQALLEREIPSCVRRVERMRQKVTWAVLRPLVDVLVKKVKAVRRAADAVRLHGPAVIPHKDMGIGPDRLLHLESASDRGGNKDLSNPHSRWSEALSTSLTACRTARFMKARG